MRIDDKLALFVNYLGIAVFTFIILLHGVSVEASRANIKQNKKKQD